jgi:hypothetical protein
MFKDQTGVVSAIAPLNECVSINDNSYSFSSSHRRPAGFKGQDVIDTTEQVCISPSLQYSHFNLFSCLISTGKTATNAFGKFK